MFILSKEIEDWCILRLDSALTYISECCSQNDFPLLVIWLDELLIVFG